jgi:hypothetical protein
MVLSNQLCKKHFLVFPPYCPTCEYGTSNFPRDICKHQALNVVQDVCLARSSRLLIGVHEVRTRTPKCLLRVLVADCGFSSPVPPPTSVASSFAVAVRYCNLKGSLTQAKLALTTRTDINQTESQKCKEISRSQTISHSTIQRPTRIRKML